MDTDDKVTHVVEDSRAAKWNVKIARPQYSVEEYEANLKDDSWSKDETDYLIDLATDFDLRWVVIGDRYEYSPPVPQLQQSDDAMDTDQLGLPARIRGTEELKARYYTVTAKCMKLRTPLATMDPTEFDVYEKMTKYDPKKEEMRKRYVGKLFERTQEQAHEEELLLKELSRIVINQEKLYQDRKALYDRLEAPRPSSAAVALGAANVYQSSQGLHQLMQSMMQQQRLRESERREKRRSALGIDTENANGQNAADGRAHRGSLGSATMQQDKRQSHSGPQHRPLSHADRAKFGISYPQERLVSGVQFRHERVVKASQAKSAVQTTRINDALAELGIPTRLPMPTAKVVAEYERLVEGVKTLVEVRKVREKVEGEIKVWEHQKALANGDGAMDSQGQEEAKAEEPDAEEVETGKKEQHQEGIEKTESTYEREDSRLEQADDDENGLAVNEDEEEDIDAREEEEDDDAERAAEEYFDEQDEVVDQDAEGSNISAQADNDDAEEDDIEVHSGDDVESHDAEDDEENADNESDGGSDIEEPGAEEEDSASVRSQTGRKRSASVMSAISNKSLKKQRK